MRLNPNHGEQSYRGNGYLVGQKVFITRANNDGGRAVGRVWVSKPAVLIPATKKPRQP